MKKLVIFVLSGLMIMMFFTSSVFAIEEKSETEALFKKALEEYETNRIDSEIKYGTLVNEEGTVEYKVKMFPVSSVEPQSGLNTTNTTITYVAYLTDEYMERVSKLGLQPYAYDSVWDSTGGVMAYLSLNINGSLDYGYIYSVHGGWDIADGAIQVTEKEVVAWTGGQRMTQYPGSLSYSYNTGFTYQSSCGGYSSCALVRGSSVWYLNLFI